MKRIIVDASVVLAGLFSDGTVRDIILNFDEAEFLAPRYLRSEIDDHLGEVIRRSKLPLATARAVVEDLLAAIELVPFEVYSASYEEAQRLARRSGAQGDEDYIAMTLELKAPVWTLDKDFERVPGLTILRTRDLESL